MWKKYIKKQSEAPIHALTWSDQLCSQVTGPSEVVRDTQRLVSDLDLDPGPCPQPPRGLRARGLLLPQCPLRPQLVPLRTDPAVPTGARVVELAGLLGHDSLDTTALYNTRLGLAEVAADLEESGLNVYG